MVPKQFIELIKVAGIKISDTPIKLIKVEKDLRLQEDKKFISINKSNVTMDIDFEIKYENAFDKNSKKQN